MLISFLLHICPEVRQLDIMNSISLLLRSLHIVLHNGYANFHPYQQCKRIHVFLRSSICYFLSLVSVFLLCFVLIAKDKFTVRPPVSN